MNIILKLKNKYLYLKKNYLINKLNGKINIDYKKSIVISGVPRGGTTWLAELLATNKNSAILWEPLSLSFLPILKLKGFKERHFINLTDSTHENISLFDSILRGKILTRGILQRTSIQQLKDADFFIIKFCRANRLLPWLTSHFEFKKTIHLLRHPCAVVSSQLSFGAWNDVEPYFTEEDLIPDGFIENYYDIIKPINTIEEKLAAIWCLDNILPLTQNNKGKWVTVTYENLLLTPKNSFQRMNIAFTDEINNKFYQPSTTTKNSSPINSKENIIQQLSYWKTKLSEQQITKILTVLNKFNITVYNKSIYPTIDY